MKYLLFKFTHPVVFRNGKAQYADSLFFDAETELINVEFGSNIHEVAPALQDCVRDDLSDEFHGSVSVYGPSPLEELHSFVEDSFDYTFEMKAYAGREGTCYFYGIQEKEA